MTRLGSVIVDKKYTTVDNKVLRPMITEDKRCVWGHGVAMVMILYDCEDVLIRGYHDTPMFPMMAPRTLPINR